MFLRLKKFMIKNRILQFHQAEIQKQAARINSLPFKMPHLTEGFDENWRELEHPDIQQSVMWHLSKVIGKQSLMPKNLLKTYLTDPEAAKNLTTYVFDKEALQKLQRDLLQNPEKYEKMLNQDNSVDPWEGGVDYGRFFEKCAAKEDNIEYKYEFNNDGHSRKG